MSKILVDREILEQAMVRGEVVLRLRELNGELLEALRLIATTDPVDAALDPQRAVRVARAAIARAEGGQT